MHNLINFISTAGYIVIFLTIFAESGFLLGFFLPGESLLFTLGILASQGYLNIWYLVVICIVAAITGDSFGYWTGKYFGPKLFRKEESLFFKKAYLEKTEAFYKKYGTKTIIIARFVPIVRTFAPIMAGVGSMKYSTFLRNNIIGGFIWAGGVLLLSYFVGQQIPDIEKYLLPVILSIIFLSVLPVLYEFYVHYRKSKKVE
jgi:membrane-associated protein